MLELLVLPVQYLQGPTLTNPGSTNWPAFVNLSTTEASHQTRHMAELTEACEGLAAGLAAKTALPSAETSNFQTATIAAGCKMDEQAMAGHPLIEHTDPEGYCEERY